MRLPVPEFHRDWKTWANALLEWLQRPQPQGAVVLPAYGVDGVPPANRDGLVVWVVDDVGGPTIAYSEGGAWKRLSDGATISLT